MFERFQEFFQNLTTDHPKSGIAPDDPRIAVAALCIQVMEADGKVENSEKKKLRKLLKEQYGLDGRQLDALIAAGQEAENEAVDYFRFTSDLKRHLDSNQRIDMTARTDGIYDAGFVGSSANIFAYDTRVNRSFDFNYNAKTPDGRGNVFFQAYYAQDVDDLNNPSPLSALNSLATRTTVDHNRRQLDIVGTRFQPRYQIGFGNELLLGMDWERSWITSNRNRAGNAPVVQLSPQDNNQTENVFGFYAEDSQNLFDDRVTLRGGIRQTLGATTLNATPWAPTLIPNTVNYQATTYSVGATARVTDWFNARVGASSGFRAPTATELGANFTTTPIGTTIFGNPNLLPETSHQMELGGTLTSRTARFDAVVFQNIISNRIAPVTISSVGGVVIQTQMNNPADIVVQGVEFQAEADVIQSLHLPVSSDWRWRFYGSGYYNFKMVDYGAVPAAGTNQATRINQYEAAIGTQFGQAGTEIPWNINVLGIFRGPMWYNTEESLSPAFFPGQIRNTTVYTKSAFTVWNTRAEVEVRKGVNLFLAVNNIFDVNQSPVFIATNQYPCTANIAKAPDVGWLREVDFHLGKLALADGDQIKARDYLRQSGYKSFEKPIVLTTPFSEDTLSGHAFASRRIAEIIPGRVYGLSGFEFTEYYFVVSDDGRQLIGIDAGTRPDSAKTAFEALRAYAPNLPELTTVFITHAHWDHVGGHSYFRALNPRLRFYARSNYNEEVEHELTGPAAFDKHFFGERFDEPRGQAAVFIIGKRLQLDAEELG